MRLIEIFQSAQTVVSTATYYETYHDLQIVNVFFELSEKSMN